MEWKGYTFLLKSIILVFLFSPFVFSDVDVRLIRPHVMLLVDTSSSMEWMAEDNTYPVCNPNRPDLLNEKNRWITALEVLTGTFLDYWCEVDDRTEPPDRIDFGHGEDVPHIVPHYSGQLADGLLDIYREQIKIGLMTFDSYESPSEAQEGMWSYGPTITWVQETPFGPCVYTWNVGARRPSRGDDDPVPGGLISVGASDRSDELNRINSRVQTTLLQTIPYWATPIAAMLDDVDFYFNGRNKLDRHPGEAIGHTLHPHGHPDVNSPEGCPHGVPGGRDRYPWWVENCRRRYVILITDGQPNTGEGVVGQRLPYKSSWEEAADLYASGIKVYVIGFHVTDPRAIEMINAIAFHGGTNEPFFADDRETLRASLDLVFSEITAASSRTRTAVSNYQTQEGQSGQYQFNTSFEKQTGIPRFGVLERTKYECRNGELYIAPEREDFADTLRERISQGIPRRLYTFLPFELPQSSNQLRHRLKAHLRSTDGEIREFRYGSLPHRVFGVENELEARKVIAFVHADQISVDPEEQRWFDGRRRHPLGAIHHSTPAILGAPSRDIPNVIYQQFKREHRQRRTILYVGTNDGILHAFDVETKEELWGFIPPILLLDLKHQLEGYRFYVDGSPRVHDLRIFKGTGENDVDEWMSVLVCGLRQGGRGYFALDVTEPGSPDDPRPPVFLWQFTHPRLGLSYGRPAFGTIARTHGGRIVEEAVAFIPGGLPASEEERRQGIGYAFFVVRLKDGEVLWPQADSDLSVIDAPIVGSPVAYNAAPGALVTRVFVGDNRGRIWRFDTTSATPGGWSFEVFHDSEVMQPIFDAPSVALDEKNQLVLVYGTGDPDYLESLEANRIFSVTEKREIEPTGIVTDIYPHVNWMLQVEENGLEPGEKLTGSPLIFDEVAYFSTFIPSEIGNECNMCEVGRGRVWGIDYEGNDPEVVNDILPRYDNDGDPLTLDDLVRYKDLGSNAVIFGIAIVKRPTCSLEEEIQEQGGRIRPQITQIREGNIELVVQTGEGGTPAQGGKTRVFTQTLRPPESLTYPDSWGVLLE
jgi:hypothetical protein